MTHYLDSWDLNGKKINHMKDLCNTKSPEPYFQFCSDDSIMDAECDIVCSGIDEDFREWLLCAMDSFEDLVNGVRELIGLIRDCDDVAKSGESDIRGMPWDKIDTVLKKFEEME